MRVAIAIWIAPLCWAQVSAVVSLSNGVQVRVAAKSAEGDLTGLTPELHPASGNSFYRVYRDDGGVAAFAYELMVGRTEDGTQFHITAKPAGSEFAARYPNADGGRPTPTLSSPAESPVLDSGGEFRIDIPTNPGLGETVTDSVQVKINARGAPAAEEGQSSAQLRFVALKVWIDGELASPPGAGAIVAGRYAVFYIPDRGGYFFSHEPVEQRPFTRIGVVEREKMHFVLDGETFECESEQPILAEFERGELWVYHNPDFHPAGNWTQSDLSSDSREQFFTAASDSLNWWLP
jgi:hypothetical protein